MLCESVSKDLVDNRQDPLYSSGNVDTAIDDFTIKLMNYPEAHPQRAQARQILREHFDTLRAQDVSATDALRSAFVAACESPNAVSIGL